MLSIGEVAARAGVTTSAIRYYERRGVLPPPERESGRRVYSPGAVQRLNAIRVAKQAGFTLDEIATLSNGFARRVPPSARWQALGRDKLRELDALVAQAQEMRRLLRDGLACDCPSLNDCQLLS